jgi:hypothetical protein
MLASRRAAVEVVWVDGLDEVGDRPQMRTLGEFGHFRKGG